MAAPEARLATKGDVPGMAEALAHAFHDDPVMAYLFGPEDDRTIPKLRRYLGHEAARHLRHPTVFTTDDHAGAALWDPPDQWKTGLRDILGLLPVMLPALRHRVVKALKLLSKMEALHEQQPTHYYLAILGTRPERQGQGVGGALLRPVLKTCDEQGLGAYLESSKDTNIPFYRSQGFEVIGEVTTPDGPTLWPMWRDPRDPTEG